MADPKEAQKWLNKAQEDFDFSCSILPETDFYSHVCFFFQQAAEKYLKAYIVRNDLEFKKIHDLTELLEICKRHHSVFEDILEECRFLNTFYIDTRYPVHWPATVSEKEARQAKKAAQKIKDMVLKAIS